MGMHWLRPAGRLPGVRLVPAPDDRRLATLLLGVGAAAVVLLSLSTPSPGGVPWSDCSPPCPPAAAAPCS
jgi:hypothetical protein